MSSRSFTPSIKVEHVISFSDAIFAFAITLMALSIDIPDLPSNLTQSELLDKIYALFQQFGISKLTISFINNPLIAFYLSCNKLWSLSYSLYNILSYGNLDKLFACNDMVACYKR